MTLFTIHAPIVVAPKDSNLGLRLVPHGFSWAGFSFGPFWLLYHRLWVSAALIVLADIALAVAVQTGKLSPEAGLGVSLALALLIGVDGHEWVRNGLARRGRALVGVTLAANETEAFAKAANSLGADFGGARLGPEKFSTLDGPWGERPLDQYGRPL